ncbi:hypothetical protein cje68_05391 [Campylobacter jejuni subsp. jejuni 1577]|nr:hypothetical protein M635_03425 [Campylobacter jejuni 32488]EIB29317.1 hypothetical protein cje110_06258 [Campylobacter jejuni subsp. jejuni LMG 23264]EIB81120.1 hypothetical protein cje68_05391 [Campylobacter jejuni subsp. jejuni 1577]CAG9347812.1 Uncharacterised protein [Campylobacter jejuni]
MQTKPIVPLADIVKEGFIMVALSVYPTKPLLFTPFA